MPEVSRFYGIMIRFYYRDHPPTHFHAIYAEHEALIEIETGNVNQGFLPKKSTRTGKRMEAIGLLTSCGHSLPSPFLSLLPGNSFLVSEKLPKRSRLGKTKRVFTMP